MKRPRSYLWAAASSQVSKQHEELFVHEAVLRAKAGHVDLHLESNYLSREDPLHEFFSVLRSGKLWALTKVPSETLMHCLDRYVLRAPNHHGHTKEGDGDEVLEIDLDTGGLHERNLKSMVQHTFSNSEL